MAGLRFAVIVLLAASCGALLLAASASSSTPRPPALYVVGDEAGWAVPPGSATGALNDWAARHRFLVGDVLAFKFGGGGDSVVLVHQADYERCSAANPAGLSAGVGAGGVVEFTLGRPGLFYFISGAPGRCAAGQRMAVRVVDARARARASLIGAAPASAPAPARGDAQPSDAPPSSGHRRLSLAQKQFAAWAIGFAAGFLLFYVSIWFFVCCSNGD